MATTTHLRLLLWSLLSWQSVQTLESVEPNAEQTFREASLQLQASCVSSGGVEAILSVAHKAGDDYGKNLPIVAARIYRDAAHAVSFFYQTNRAVLPAYLELGTGMREHSHAFSLVERLSALNVATVPLDTVVNLKVGGQDMPIRVSELELQLITWRELSVELERVVSWGLEIPGPHPQPPSDRGNLAEQATYRNAITRWREAVERTRYFSDLRNYGGNFTNRVVAQIAREYGKSSHRIESLQELMDGYLPPEVSTPVMNKVFEAMPSGVAAKTPRPVPGAKGERWIRPPAPRLEPSLPAIARPSKLRESMGVRGGPSAGAAESGRPLWHWLGLAIAVAVSGWVWLRLRS